MFMRIMIFKITSVILTVALFFTLCGCSSAKVNAELVKDKNLAEAHYKLGDYMGDYTMTDVNGNTYTFSEILKEKKAIVLNFWFINCQPCKMEFPYLQKAYTSYNDEIEVLAINIVDDKENDIIEYAEQNAITIPMLKGENTWGTALSLQGFPTTVVVDRYGSIAFMHMGSVTDDGVFEKIFDFFTADNYKQTTIKNISDIK